MFSRLFFSSKQSATLPLEPPRTPSPTLSIGSTVAARAVQGSPSAAALNKSDAVRPGTPPVSTADLVALVKSVPPKALHSFILSRLSSTSISSDELNFYSTLFLLPSQSGLEPPLVPPPRLHCFRCHLDYFEVENTARSCIMVHDDESAVVERVGRGKKLEEYETNWGCCGQTVDGDGDLGPPAGFCFEGPHTIDRAAAKYRADADSDDDKLESCEKKRCGQPKTRGHKRNSRGEEKAKSNPTSISSISAVTDESIGTPEVEELSVKQKKPSKRRKVA